MRVSICVYMKRVTYPKHKKYRNTFQECEYITDTKNFLCKIINYQHLACYRKTAGFS